MIIYEKLNFNIMDNIRDFKYFQLEYNKQPLNYVLYASDNFLSL